MPAALPTFMRIRSVFVVALSSLVGCGGADRTTGGTSGGGAVDENTTTGTPRQPSSSSGGVAGGQINNGYGLTFASLAEASRPDGTVHMSCHGAPKQVDQPHAGSCNPYVGDTQCAKELPVLCVRKDQSAAPAGYEFGFYNGWIGGSLASTAPVAGTALMSRERADARCRAELGDGYVMAEFHDAQGGWGFVGNAGQIDSAARHWVFIDDQPGNCWDAPSNRQ